MLSNFTKLYKRMVIGCAAVMLGVVGIISGVILLGMASDGPSNHPIWDGTSSSTFAGGSGSELDPYLIQTGEQLARITRVVNTNMQPEQHNTADIYYRLDSDIYLNGSTLENMWAPIGIEAYPFNANFDGGGYVISGIYMNMTALDYQGMFGVSTGTIKNVTVKNGSLRGRHYVGAIVGTTTSDVINCHNTNVPVTGGTAVGGIAGYSTGMITNCSNTAEVNGAASTSSGHSYTGGIAGVAGEITNCENTGAITGGTGGSEGHSYTGGIAGASSEIVDCKNTSAVTGGAGGASGQSYTGGIVGYTGGKIINPEHAGNVKGGDGGINGNSYTGGIAGLSDEIINPENSGIVTGGNGGTDGSSYTGGFVGSSNAVVNDSHNRCTVIGGNGIGNGSSYTGGLVGSLGGAISNSYNTGNITGGNGAGNGSSYTGGITGLTIDEINKSYNMGVVRGGTGGAASNSYTGAITGHTTADIKNSHNSAAVIGGNGGSNNFIQSFSYTGGVQSVTLQPGVYLLEVWGANGGAGAGGNSYAGGKGGYSKGLLTLTDVTTIYVVVGGEGSAGSSSTSSASGGYNGGGSGWVAASPTYRGGGGGGATHISTATGLLSASSVRSVLCLAGGGGGGGAAGATAAGSGGYNGGGISGAESTSTSYGGRGGTQTAGGAAASYSYYTAASSGSAGVGGNAGSGGDNYAGGGGGGGYFGGGGSCIDGGAGGSGYIGGVKTGTTARSGASGFVTNPVSTGHGYARISQDGNTFTGGIAGFAGQSIDMCYNEAEVTGGTGGYSAVGGIAGEVNKVSNSYNTSKVTARDGAGFFCIGGLVAVGVANNSFNAGTIVGGDSSAEGTRFIGGLVGQGGAYNSYNIGAITAGTGSATAYTGGVVGSSTGTTYGYFLKTDTINSNLNVAGTGSHTESFSFNENRVLSGFVSPFYSSNLLFVLRCWAEETPPPEDINEYLLWQAGDPYPEHVPTYSIAINFVTNGANSIMPASVPPGTTSLAAFEPNEPTRKGYTFDGWYSDSRLTEPFDFSTEAVPKIDITIYAKWTVKSHIVTYVSNGGDSEGPMSKKIDYDSTTALDVPAREGYTFDGWFDTAANASANAASGRITTATGALNSANIMGYVAGGKWAVTVDITVYARWVANTNTIIFRTNGGNAIPSAKFLTDDESLSEYQPMDPTRKGHIFAGWYKDEFLTQPFDFHFEPVPPTSITVYADWTLRTSIITLDNNGAVTTFSYTYGEPYPEVLPSDLVLEDHTFDGWFYLSELIDETKWEAFLDNLTSNVTLYAKFTPYPVITLISNGVTIDTIIIPPNSDIADFVPNNPTRTGYTFNGWYKEATFVNLFDFESEETPTRSMNIYAEWKAKKYTIVYNFDGGAHPTATTTIAEWGKNFVFAVPSKAHYYFAGWFTVDGKQLTPNTGNGIGVWNTDTDTGIIEVRAHWNPVVYNMNFDSDGGTAVLQVSFGYGEKIDTEQIPENPTKQFAMFIGWFTSEGVEFNFYNDTMPAGGITLKAKWASDVSLLVELMQNLQDYMNPSGYDVSLYKDFTDALADANQILGTTEPTPDQVRTAFNKLTDAVAALKNGPDAPPPSDSSSWIFIVLGVVFLLGGAGVAVWLVMKKRKSMQTPLPHMPAPTPELNHEPAKETKKKSKANTAAKTKT